MKRTLLLFLVLFMTIKSQAQIGIGINPPDPSAILHVQDTTRGMLIPRMKDVNRIAIESPAEGLLVYQTNAEKGFWYFTSGQWKNLTASNGGGKATLTLRDDITDAEAALKIASDVGPNTQVINITYCTNLTTVDLSMITNLTDIYITGNYVLQSVNFSNLQTVDNNININGSPITNLPLSNLKSVSRHLKLYGLSIPSLNLPLLKAVYGMIWVNNNNALTTVNMPQLIKSSVFDDDNYDFPSLVSWLSIKSNPLLTSITLSAFPEASVLEITDNTNLQTLNVPVLVKAKTLIYNNNGATSVTFPVLKKTGHLEFKNNSHLTSFSCPVMDSLVSAEGFLVGDFEDEGLFVNNNALLQTVSLPLLKHCESVNIEDDPVLTSVSLPLLNSITSDHYYFVIKDCVNLTSINIDGLAKTIEGIDMTGNKLASAQVNYLLHKFATLTVPLLNHEIKLTQIVAAPPTGQGLIDKATLQSQGNAVYTN